jgi:hypothetical protein
MPDEKVTDEQLNEAADMVNETADEEEVVASEEDIETEAEEISVKEEEDVPQEPDRLQQVELGLNELKFAMQDMFDQIGERITSSQTTTTVVNEDEIDLEAPATVGDIERILSRAEQKKSEAAEAAEAAKAEYHKGYLRTLTKLGRSVDGEEYEAIYKRMESDYDDIITGNPEVDAELNFRRAMTAVAKDATPKNPVTGKRSTGVSAQLDVTTNNAKPSPGKKIKLDSVAEEFVRMTGMDSDKVEKALTGEPPNSLFGRGKI